MVQAAKVQTLITAVVAAVKAAQAAAE